MTESIHSPYTNAVPRPLFVVRLAAARLGMDTEFYFTATDAITTPTSRHGRQWSIRKVTPPHSEMR